MKCVATSNDPWGPSGTEMSEIARMTFDTFVDLYLHIPSHTPSPPHTLDNCGFRDTIPLSHLAEANRTIYTVMPTFSKSWICLIGD